MEKKKQINITAKTIEEFNKIQNCFDSLPNGYKELVIKGYTNIYNGLTEFICSTNYKTDMTIHVSKDNFKHVVSKKEEIALYFKNYNICIPNDLGTKDLNLSVILE